MRNDLKELNEGVSSAGSVFEAEGAEAAKALKWSGSLLPDGAKG